MSNLHRFKDSHVHVIRSDQWKSRNVRHILHALCMLYSLLFDMLMSSN
jgi:hypothetical protein